MTTANATWQMAHKQPFEAFGILYYPLFRSRADLPGTLDDEDMAWAVTANTNLEGTGYTLSQPSILTLASAHHALKGLRRSMAFLPLATTAADGGINPLADLQRLVPDVTATPMYPDFPTQVMQMDEAQYRYHQACHYLSTYGVEWLAGQLGLDVTVSEGWLPEVEATEKTRDDEALVAPKVLHVLVTVEDLQSVVAARLARATRMHPAEIQTALLVFDALGNEDCTGIFPKIAFHENMMELIRTAAQEDSATLERVAASLAQHPGDLIKATMHLLARQPKNHLLTKQKKGLCRAFEHFPATDIAHNIADAGSRVRRAHTYLSVERFAGPRLREALELVERGQVRSWTAELESLWGELHATRLSADTAQPDAEQAWRRLLAFYGQRPGMLFRSIARLMKAACPPELLVPAVMAHVDSYALPTIVRTLTNLSDCDTVYRLARTAYASFYIFQESLDEQDKQVRSQLCPLLRELLAQRLTAIDTPLRGKRIYLDTAGISLRGSVVVPNETGDTGTAWPPVGVALDLPEDKTIRFFTYWDDASDRVDVDLHFTGRSVAGEDVNVGWNADCSTNGLVTSGDITTSQDSVEFLDANMAEARDAGVYFVVQEQHIFAGADSWGDIATCYSGAVVVGDTAPDVKLVSAKNVIFRDDMTGEGTLLSYAVVNFPQHYVRIVRGANIPLGDVSFSLADYLDLLFETQGATRVSTPEDADLTVCVGRSDDPNAVSLFDEGFFIG